MMSISFQMPANPYHRINYNPTTRVLQIELYPTWINKWMRKWATQETVQMSFNFWGPMGCSSLNPGSTCEFHKTKFDRHLLANGLGIF